MFGHDFDNQSSGSASRSVPCSRVGHAPGKHATLWPLALRLCETIVQQLVAADECKSAMRISFKWQCMRRCSCNSVRTRVCPASVDLLSQAVAPPQVLACFGGGTSRVLASCRSGEVFQGKRNGYAERALQYRFVAASPQLSNSFALAPQHFTLSKSVMATRKRRVYTLNYPPFIRRATVRARAPLGTW